MRFLATVGLVIVAGMGATARQTIDLAKYTIVDLSHSYGPSTIF